MKTITKTLLAIGLAGIFCLPALAADRVVMKDGREFVGKITQETEYVIRISVTHGQLVKELVLYAGDIAKIEKGITVDSAESDATTPRESDSKTSASAGTKSIAAFKPGVLVLPLTGGVGEEFRHHEIEKVAAEARRIKKDQMGEAPIIVLEIESGGGGMIEMYAIHDTLMELKKDFRIVAWIKEAISAAAATAFHCDEIYFYTDGTLGAMTGYNSGTGQSLQGEMLERWLNDAAAWAEAGGRPGILAKAMIRNEYEVSYDIDPDTGQVIWHEDLSGAYDLSGPDDNLVLNATTARHCGFADGIADTPEKLAELLDLPEWHEVSDYGRRAHEEWMDTFALAREDILRIYGLLQITQSSPAADQQEKLGRSIQLIQQLIVWWDRAPTVCERYGIPSKGDLERILAEYRKQLADLKRAEARNRRGGRGGGG